MFRTFELNNDRSPVCLRKIDVAELGELQRDEIQSCEVGRAECARIDDDA